MRAVAATRRMRQHRFALYVAAVCGALIAFSNLTSAVDQLAGGAGTIRDWVDRAPAPTSTSAVLVGEFREVRLGAANIPLALVYHDRGLATDQIAPEDLAWIGQMVSYQVVTKGMAVGRRFFVGWTLYDGSAEAPARVPDGRWRMTNAEGWPDGAWTVAAGMEDVASGELWVPHPLPGTYFLELELFYLLEDDRRVVLDLERTEPFVIA
jgi:hypothetical protein